MAPTKQFKVDFSLFTVAEFDAFAEISNPTKDEQYAFLGKACGASADQIKSLPYDAYQKLLQEYKDRMAGKDAHSPS
jgi:hypothetical protein